MTGLNGSAAGRYAQDPVRGCGWAGRLLSQLQAKQDGFCGGLRARNLAWPMTSAASWEGSVVLAVGSKLLYSRGGGVEVEGDREDKYRSSSPFALLGVRMTEFRGGGEEGPIQGFFPSRCSESE